MHIARPPFVRGDIVTMKNDSREIMVTGYGTDPEKEANMKHSNQPTDEKVVYGYYPDDEKKAEHWWREEDLKFVRSA